MLFDNGDLDATLASAAGDDPALLAELRQAFGDSIARQLDLLTRSRCDGNWAMAALRLKGVAASFHAAQLMELAEEAAAGAPGDPVVLRKIATFLSDYRSGALDG